MSTLQIRFWKTKCYSRAVLEGKVIRKDKFKEKCLFTLYLQQYSTGLLRHTVQ